MTEQKWARGYGEILPIYGENGEYKGAIDTRTTTGFEPGQEIYSYTKDGETVYTHKKEDIPTWVELNEETGDIKVQAPDVVLNSESYKKTVKPLLEQLSTAYKTNKDYKLPNPFDSSDEKTDYSVKDIVRKVQDAININQMSLGNYYRAQDNVREQLGEKAAERFTPERYAILAASGLSGEDDDIISIPRSVSNNQKWVNFFKEAESFSNDAMTVKDFEDKYYHADFGRDMLNFNSDNAHELKKFVSEKINELQNKGFDNLTDDEYDEYLRLQAFSRYLNGSEPRKDIINTFVEEIWGVGESVARGTADFASGIVSIVDGLWNRVFSLEEGTEAYKRFGNPLSKDITGITNIGTNIILGATGQQLVSYDDMLTTDHVSSELQKLYDERAQFYIDTNKEAATWFMIGYAGTKVAENIAAGKAVTSVALGSVAKAAGAFGINATEQAFAKAMGLSSIPEGVKSGNQIMNLAITGTETPTMYQLISGLSRTNPADVVNMSKLIVQTAAESKNATAFASALNGFSATVKATQVLSKVATIGDLTAQVFVDTALQDPVATRKLIEGSGTDEERALLWQNAAWNASGYGAGLLLSKMMTAFPKSTTGKAANEAATRKLWQLEGWISSKRDDIKEAMFGKDWMKDIKNPGKKQVAQYKYVLNKAGEAIAKSGGDVSKTAASVAGSKMASGTAAAVRNMRAVEVAISQKEAGYKVKINEYMSDAHPEMKSTVTTLDNVTQELTKKLTSANLKSDYKLELGNYDVTMGWPREVNNYVGNLIQKRILDNKVSSLGLSKIPTADELDFKFSDAQKRAYPKLTERISKAEESLPKDVTDYIKNTYIPALYRAATAIRSYRMSPKVSLDIEDEIMGYINTGMWGNDGTEFAPMIRITEAQKQYAEEKAGMMSTTKTGFIKNRSSDPEKIKWGSEADFVNPTFALHRYLLQTAVDDVNQNMLRAMLNVSTIKNEVRVDGKKTGAARTYESLSPALEKAISDGVGDIKSTFDADGIADLVLADYRTKADIQKAETQKNKATKEIDKLEKGDVKIGGIDKTRAIQSMSNANIENVLSDEFKKRAKGGSALNGYTKVAIVEDAMVDASTWKMFILNSPISVRRAIKRAVDGYGQLTGTRYTETGNTMRGRLNALVPGCDVYNWGLLGREFTNGLTNEGLYTFKGGTPEVQAYIMSTDDLRKLTGLTSEANYVKNHKNEGDATRVLEALTVENVQGVIPVRRLGDTFVPGSEFGHAGITAITPIEWYKYFDYLDSNGITSIPVAISQLPLSKPVDFGTPEYINRSKSTSELLYERQLAIKDLEEKSALREQWEANGWKTDTGADVREQQQSKNGKKLPGTSKLELLDADIKKAEELIGQYDKYSIDSSVNNKLGHTSQNITEDMKQMFEEEGYIPFFHNQDDELGSVEYNDKSKVPTGVDAYTYKGGVGDAYWIAPNATYTDDYGANKLIAKIPKDSLLTDKELQSLKKELFNEKKKLLDKGIHKKISDTHQKLYAKVEKEFNRGSDAALAALERHENGEIEYDDALEEFAMAQMNNDLLSKSEKDMYGDFIDYQGFINDDNFAYKEGATDYIRDEDVKRYLELNKYIDDYGNVISYRAIAEKTGKPMIDTTMEMQEKQATNGTAYFYYKDIDPEFDNKMGEQLVTQAETDTSWTKDIASEMAKDVLDNYTVEDFVDEALRRSELSELEQMKLKNAIDTAPEKDPKESANVLAPVKVAARDLDYSIRMKSPAIANAIERIGNYLALNKGATMAGTTVGELLEYFNDSLSLPQMKTMLDELGIQNPKVVSDEAKAKWDAIDPTNPSNVPVHKFGFEPVEDDTRSFIEKLEDPYFEIDEFGDEVQRQQNLNDRCLPAPIGDPSLEYGAFKLVSEINPDVITDVNRAMLKANKEARGHDLVEKIAKNQKAARIKYYATIRLNEAAKTLNMPTLNSRMKFIEMIDNAIDGVELRILSDDNAVKVLDAIMVSQDVDEEVAREYAMMVFINKHKKDFNDAAKDVFKYGKFKNDAGKMPGTTIAKMENQMTKEIGRRIEERLNDARNVYVAAGGEVVDGDKVLKEIHDLMDEIEKAGHDANVVALRRNGEELLVETDPVVANIANYHVIDTTSSAEKILSNPVVKGMNRMARFFQTIASPKSVLKNQPTRDTLNTYFSTGAVPIMDGMKYISKELADKYGEALVEQFKELYPSDYDFIKENLKDGEDITSKVLDSLFAQGTSTSPALTETAYYREPFAERGTAEDFWGLTEQFKKGLGMAIKKGGEMLEAPNQAREVYLRNLNFSRGLKDGLDAGMSLEDAMNMAKFFRDNGTTNFRHQLYHFRALAGTVNYFGAGINGYTSFWRLFSLDPVGVSTRIFGGLVVPIIVATGMSLASEENRERYEGLKEYEKNNFFVFVMNGKVYKIPIPQEFSTFVNPIRHAVESLYGSNKHAFWELMMTDMLNIGPMEFGALMDIDRNEFSGDPTILDRMGSLGLSLIDQTAPLVLKTLFTFATGIDTYTGQPINTSYYSFDEDGNRILIGGTQSEFSLALGKATGWSPSVIAWTTKNLFGTVGRDILDTIASGDITKPLKNTISDLSLSSSDYNRTASDWNREIADLWRQKEATYLPLYNDYVDQINKENDPEEKKKLKNKMKDALNPFFNQVKAAVTALNQKYPGMYDRYRFGSVVSLLIFDNGSASGTDSAARERDLQNFYQNRNQAYQWMQDLGISGSDSDSILGHLELGKDGKVTVKINNPLEILSAQSLFYGSGSQHVSNIKTILESGTDSYKNQLKAVKQQINDIYNRGNLKQSDYDEIDNIKIEWDKKVISALAPYVQQYSAESAINNSDVIEYLSDYLYVPDAFKINNRGYHVTNKSLNYLGSAEDAFKENFIKYAFGVNDHRYENNWNFSNHKTLGGK